MVGFISVTVDFSQIIGDIDGKLRELGPTKNFALRDIGAEAVKEMRARVHVITGRTKASTKIASVSDNEVIVESTFGAYYEEQRGEPHDFMTQTAEVMNQKIPTIVRNRFDKINR